MPFRGGKSPLTQSSSEPDGLLPVPSAILRADEGSDAADRLAE